MIKLSTIRSKFLKSKSFICVGAVTWLSLGHLYFAGYYQSLFEILSEVQNVVCFRISCPWAEKLIFTILTSTINIPRKFSLKIIIYYGSNNLCYSHLKNNRLFRIENSQVKNKISSKYSRDPTEWRHEKMLSWHKFSYVIGFSKTVVTVIWTIFFIDSD